MVPKVKFPRPSFPGEKCKQCGMGSVAAVRRSMVMAYFLQEAFNKFGVLAEDSSHCSRYWNEYVDHQIERHKKKK